MRSSIPSFPYSPSPGEHSRKMACLCYELGTTDTQGPRSSQLHKCSFSAEHAPFFPSLQHVPLSCYSPLPQHTAICVCAQTANPYSKAFPFIFFFSSPRQVNAELLEMVTFYLKLVISRVLLMISFLFCASPPPPPPQLVYMIKKSSETSQKVVADVLRSVGLLH